MEQKFHHSTTNDIMPRRAAAKAQPARASAVNIANHVIQIHAQIKKSRSILFKSHVLSYFGR